MVSHGEIYHAQTFFVFVKTTTSMAVGLFTTLFMYYYYSHMCVCVNALEAKFLKGFYT